jgi:hypothetical protein
MSKRTVKFILSTFFVWSIAASQLASAQSPSPSPSPGPDLSKVYTSETVAQTAAAGFNQQYGEIKLGVLRNPCYTNLTHPQSIENRHYVPYVVVSPAGVKSWRVMQSFSYVVHYNIQTKYGKENFHTTCTCKLYKTGENGWSMGLCTNANGSQTMFTDATYSTAQEGGYPRFVTVLEDPVKGNYFYSWVYGWLKFTAKYNSMSPPCSSSVSSGGYTSYIYDEFDLSW